MSSITNLTSRFPVYAVDFAVEAAGKRVATTKRRVRWRFGFTNRDALERGETGTACRGSEHEINITWSLTSGKRQITMDRKEVHFSVGRGGRFEYSWSMRGNHVLKVVAYATAPINNPGGFRQYDMLVDGQSFFDMPKIFEVGLSGPPQAQARSPGDYSHYSTIQEREEQDLQAAIAESLAESRRHLQSQNRELPSSTPAPAPSGGDLLDVSGLQISTPAPPPPAPAAYPPRGAPITSFSTGSYSSAGPAPFMSPGSVGTAPPPFQSPPPVTSPGGYSAASAPPPMTQPVAGLLPPIPGQPIPGQAPPPPQPPVVHAPPPPPGGALLGAPPPQPSSQFPTFPGEQPLPPVDDPFAPKPPSQNEVLSSIMDAYAAGGPPPTPGAPIPQPNFQTPNGHAPAAPANTPVGQPHLSMNAPLALAANETDGQPKSEMEKALSNLVNFDDINEPAEKEMKLTMMKEEDERKKRNPHKSVPLPPVATNMVASGATLSQIQSVKPERSVADPSSIMKPPPQLFSPEAVSAGALVVHGQPMPLQGPPPIQQGFGVGHGPPPQAYGGYRGY